jgi:hypothetical protein
MKTIQAKSDDFRVAGGWPFPVIEGTAATLAKLASGVLAALKHEEAVVMHNGQPVIGIRLMPEPGCPCVGTPDEEDCPHE